MISNFKFTYLDEVESTQDTAKAMLSRGEISHGDVVLAKKQLAGRGRYGRTWVSPEGGLYLTLCLKPNVEVELWPQISYVIGVALCDSIKNLDNVCSPLLKWVNDVMMDGKKIGGILLEMVGDVLLIGIGVNIMQHPSIEAEGGASIRQYSKVITAEALCEVLFKRILYYYNFWYNSGFIAIRNLWIHEAYGVGQRVTVRMRDRNETGIFVGVDNVGHMQLLQSGSMNLIAAGEVFFS